MHQHFIHRLDPEQFEMLLRVLGGLSEERTAVTILHSLKTLHEKVDIIMAVTKEMAAVLSRIDAATNAVAKKIDDLNTKISTDMSQEDVTAVTTQLGAIADHLEAIASNPTNPVPQPPPAAELPPVPPAPAP